MYQKNKILQNINIKLSSRILMTLKSSVVIFQALGPLQPRWPHWPLQPQQPIQPQKPYFTKELCVPDSWIAPGTKWLILFPFGWMNHQKTKFSLISYTISVRSCWGQSTLLFWNPRMCIKNLLSQDSKTTFKQDFTYIFQSVRANS